MSSNSSSTDLPPLSSNASAPPVDCYIRGKSALVLAAFSITNILLLLPLCLLVLPLGFQRWRRRRRTPAAASAAGHSDTFTYHMVAMEMVAVLCCLLYCVGVSLRLPAMATTAFDVFFCLWSIKIFFQALTCVEHYLAVVHPVAYLGLRTEGGVRARNGSIGCVWLLCSVWGVLILTRSGVVTGLYFYALAFVLAVVCFCCLSVLRALRRPGPGDAGPDRDRVAQTKQRAFNTVVTVMGALWLCLGGTLACNVLVLSLAMDPDVECAVLVSTAWFSLPSSSVLPLLYLHRAGRLPCCKY